MWNPPRVLLVPAAAALLLLIACGSDSGASSDSIGPESSVAEAPGTESSAPAPSTTAPPTPPASTAPPSSEPAPTDQPTTGDAVEIIVNVDDPAQTGQTFPVALGQTVILRLVSDTDQEYHVHVVDLEKQVAAGVEATFEFTADTPGPIEVESHTTGALLATIQVA